MITAFILCIVACVGVADDTTWWDFEYEVSQVLLLWRIMACFHMISISLISSGDHPCAHYFLWILPVCALLLCSMTHYDIRMAHAIARDALLLHNNG